MLVASQVAASILVWLLSGSIGVLGMTLIAGVTERSGGAASRRYGSTEDDSGTTGASTD